MKIRRREFLAAAPAGALASGALAAAPAWAAPCGVGEDHAVDAGSSAIALGYWEGSEVAQAAGQSFEAGAETGPELALEEGAQVRRLASAVFDARALPSGDPRFLLGPAKVRVLGLIDGRAAREPSLPSLILRVRSDPARDYAHDVWSYRGGPVPAIASPIEVTVPVHESEGLHLSVVEGAREATIRLSLGIAAGAKLRRGLYLLSWGGEPISDWHRYGFAAVEPAQPESDPTRYRLLQRGLDPAPAGRPVLAFTVGFADDAVA